MKSNFEERRQNRKDRYEELADKNRQQSQERYQTARNIGKHIPMGQPILVGHHSERGHRADIKRIDNNMRKSIEHDGKARYYEQKAQTIENDRTIYSDDPEAIQKLRCRLKDLEEYQSSLKAINKLCRSKKLKDEEITKQLADEYGLNASTIHQLLNPTYSYEKRGFQSWRLSNNNANIRRIRERIAQLEKAESEETTEQIVGDVKIVDSVEHNRLQIFFPDKPSVEVRAELKQHGFRWSRQQGCWQRHRSNTATYQSERIIRLYNEGLQ
ncbi:DUF3560 domain-containing protein [Tunicatimonas pelagia]|uniref:DUF3560 domain-containing protein n=1 Tax=Tunicatimonas pelagia TaxID=931531 RepID=UPI0026668D3B|nr:DUF3560 domain-containing protein [Tunicatimonas pelagia]WKN46456.1 DUF3560 domain-containing protein [Tunicatimonas pelagia]